ncbi:YbjN domain-containing protein [Glycocaulis abyssi]|uniref:YbjN domain-containing protein n=1 Tax=Glycocaulis abyssi TaxID=1433403 RepID=A0ABV9NIR2_9PROT
MTLIIRALLATAVVAVCATPALSQDTHPVIERIDAQGLRALVTGLGHDVTNEAVTEEGQPILTATTGNMNYMVAGTVCENGQCQGLLTELVFTNTPASLEIANQVNQTYAAIKLVVVDDDSVVFSRYDVLNGGTTLGALSTSVSTLLDIAASIVQTSDE